LTPFGQPAIRQLLQWMDKATKFLDGEMSILEYRCCFHVCQSGLKSLVAVLLPGVPERSQVACGSLETSSSTQLRHFPAEAEFKFQ
jgi:hypothetical protein